jgi:hypothetical protein
MVHLGNQITRTALLEILEYPLINAGQSIFCQLTTDTFRWFFPSTTKTSIHCAPSQLVCNQDGISCSVKVYDSVSFRDDHLFSASES